MMEVSSIFTLITQFKKILGSLLLLQLELLPYLIWLKCKMEHFNLIFNHCNHNDL